MLHALTRCLAHSRVRDGPDDIIRHRPCVDAAHARTVIGSISYGHQNLPDWTTVPPSSTHGGEARNGPPNCIKLKVVLMDYS